MTPLVSIIIPVFNVEKYLRECLDSVLAQTCGDWEALCVDDGSTDSSGAILDEYAARDGRFRVFHQPNAGVSAARNKALDEAKGDWVCFLDADDVFVPDALEKSVFLVSDGKCDALFLGSPIYFRNSAPRSASGSGRVIMELLEPQDGAKLLLSGKLWGWPAVRFLKANFFRGAKFPVGVANLEDSMSLLDVLSVTARWRWVDLSVYGYRSREGSASSRMTTAKVKAIMENFAEMYEAAISKLHLPRKGAMVMMRQYSDHMSIYIAHAVPEARMEDLREIADAYAKASRRMGYGMANLFVKAILFNAEKFGTKRGAGFLLRLHELYIRAKSGIRRRLMDI